MKLSRKKLEALAWRYTHRDFKGGKGEGRTIMVPDGGGSTLVELRDATEAQLLDKLPPVEREQARTGRTFERGQRFKLTVGQAVIVNGREPGEVLNVSERGFVDVKTADGAYHCLSPVFPVCYPAE